MGGGGWRRLFRSRVWCGGGFQFDGFSLEFDLLLVMRMCWIVLGWLVAVAAGSSSLAEEALDHQGRDWSPSDGSIIGGAHRNIGVFRLGAGKTVFVGKVGSDLRGGWLRVEAREILIDPGARLDGSGAGLTGGAGGGGGGGADQFSPGSGGAAGAGLFSTASPGSGGWSVVGGGGGRGGRGLGRFPGQGGAGGIGGGLDRESPAGQGGRGFDGGYGAPGKIGVGSGETRDVLVFRGSGGGGGAGGGGGHSYRVNSGGGGGGGGGAGGAGGASIELVASDVIVLDGEIRARGATGVSGIDGGSATSYSQISNGLAGAGGAGGSGGSPGLGHGGLGGTGAEDLVGDLRGAVSPPGAVGGDGGAGSGGGVLLHAPRLSGVGAIDARGGRLQRSNGGVVKLFVCEHGLDFSTNRIAAGAIQRGSLSGIAPLVALDPESAAVSVGESVCFRSEIIGAESFQWEHRGQPIPGARGSEYCIDPVRPEDAGEYALVARNACGETRTATAVLTIRRATRLAGLVWDDVYGDGQPGSRLITGRFPLLVILLDVSEGTLAPARGAPVGDLNRDGHANTVLDAEIAAVERLMQRVRDDDGMGSKIRLCIMTAQDPPVLLDLRPKLAQIDWRWVSTAGGDQDNDGISDVSAAIRQLRAAGRPRWTGAIQAAESTVDGLPSRLPSVDGAFLPTLNDVGERNMLVMGHHVSDVPELALSRVSAAARSRPINLRVIAIGSEGRSDAEVERATTELRRIDPDLLIPASTEELLEMMATTVPRHPQLQEQGLAGATVFVDVNRDQTMNPGEPFAQSLGGLGLEPNLDLDLESHDSGRYEVRVIAPSGLPRLTSRASLDGRQVFVDLGPESLQLPDVRFPMVRTNLTPCFVTSIPPVPTLQFSSNGGFVRYPFVVNTRAYPECRWEAVASEPWILLPNGNSGWENGYLDIFVQANTNLDHGRSGQIYICGKGMWVLQDGGPASGVPPPLDPRNLRVARLAATEADLAWDASFGATRHQLALSRRADFSQLIPPADPAELGLDLSYKVTGLEPGTVYYARLTAFNQSEPSRAPARLSFRTAPCNPDLVRLHPGPDFTHSGGLGYVELVMPARDCPWQVTGLPPWITVDRPASGHGSGNIPFRLLPNLGPARRAVLVFQGRSVEIRQSAGSVNLDSGQLMWEAGIDLRIGTDAEPGHRLLIFHSEDLLDWEEAGEETVAGDGSIRIRQIGDELQRFYRVEPMP